MTLKELDKEFNGHRNPNEATIFELMHGRRENQALGEDILPAQKPTTRKHAHANMTGIFKWAANNIFLAFIIGVCGSVFAAYLLYG